MTKAEAAALVAMLVAAFPGSRFGEENAAAYEIAIADLDAAEAHAAVNELVKTERFLPAVAAIRESVFRTRKLQRAAQASALSIKREDGRLLGPRPDEWARTLTSMLADSERWCDMARRFYAARGRQGPVIDPAQPFIELAQAGARGDDVRERFNREVMHNDESEKRYP